MSSIHVSQLFFSTTIATLQKMDMEEKFVILDVDAEEIPFDKQKWKEWLAEKNLKGLVGREGTKSRRFCVLQRVLSKSSMFFK